MGIEPTTSTLRVRRATAPHRTVTLFKGGIVVTFSLANTYGLWNYTHCEVNTSRYVSWTLAVFWKF